MTTAIRLALFCLALILLLGAVAWYYLFGPNRIAAADLVPGDTLVFATIPNAAAIATDYQTSHLKELFDSPNVQPAANSLVNLIGQKNVDLLQAFLPELSGQSFLAVTHYEPANPSQAGLIAGLKPKPGVGNFQAFVDKLKAAYPQAVAQATTGAGQIEGLDYQWIKGPGATDKICVAQYRGWIITAWGESSLQDWWERLQKKSTAPSLSANADYQKSLARVGANSEAILYVDFHTVLGMMQKQLAGSNPQINALAQKWQALGGGMIGTRFEHGEIADHFSLLLPRAAQAASGISGTPCAFDTLKFTSPDTRFYWARSLNAGQIWKNLQDQTATAANPMLSGWITGLQSWAQSENLDLQHNVIDALGDEASLQVEWGSDVTYPEVGIFAKLAKPDDFKPVVAAVIDTLRKQYGTIAVVNEINSNNQNFATLKFVQPLPISPTITEDGPYFGLFLTENQAVRSFQRDASVGLLNDPHFKAQIGDKRNGASEILFFDSPQFLDRAYQTAMPYLSLAAMVNRTLGSLLQNRTLPPNLQWLAPIGTWSMVVSYDDDGTQGYSISGIGNQGIFLSGALGGSDAFLGGLGHPTAAFAPTTPGMVPGSMPAMGAPPGVPPAPGPDASTNAASEMAPAPTAPPAPMPASDAMTNTAPDTTSATTPPPASPGPDASTNTAPEAAPAPTNATPSAPAPAQ
jgi:hypothetical protein